MSQPAFSQTSSTCPAFEFIRREEIASLNVTVEEYRHSATGARHFHLVADDHNNAFLVAFLTVPQDSTGVAHILEHTSLCGSGRYPVRDPFFMMIRRSLSTFMNAFTSSDWTAYPFATQSRKDFDNLLQVYLDAAFFPNLNALDFAQEGHRVEFAKPADSSTPLAYKGVVFNEMKGSMSSPVNMLWKQLSARLFPTTTYHYNSGGDPEEIPKLSYAQLKAFHRQHYHPSNAIFMTYGNIPAAAHQARFQELALSRFQAQGLELQVPDEQRYSAPLTAETAYALEGETDTTHKTHIVVGWLLGKSMEPMEAMSAHLLSGVLLDHSASPLRHALETSALGTAPSDLCGLDDSSREMAFVAGLEGSDPEHAQAVEALILEVLERVAQEGVPEEQVASVLHQLEISQREIKGGGFPYGLRLMLSGLSPALHGGDPLAFWNIDPVLEHLREAIKDPHFIKQLARHRLLDNPHRVRLVMTPDTQLSARKAAAESARLAALKEVMSEQEKARVVELAAALQARQLQEDDPEILPKVTLEDVPLALKIAEGQRVGFAQTPGSWFAQGTNGMVYEQVVVDLPNLDPPLLDALPLFCDCLTEVGCGELDYLQTQSWQAAVSGGIGARCSIRGEVGDVQQVRGVFVLAGKALVRNQAALAELLRETFFRARFDELSRLRELIAQLRTHRESMVTNQGHVLAMLAACARMSPAGQLAHRWGGLHGLKRLKSLDTSLEDPATLKEFAARLHQVKESILRAPRQFLVVGEEAHRPAITTGLEANWQGFVDPQANLAGFTPAPVRATVKQAWATSTQVNFCAQAYPTVPASHPDAPVLTVLGGFLRNGFLHRAIREQGGAYGAGASYDSDAGALRFYSYRDPHLLETLEDFDRSLHWLQTHDHEPRTLEEAILGVISMIDRPDSPAGEAISAFFDALHGRTPEQRRQFRQRVLQVSLDDLRRVASTYLLPEHVSTAVISNPSTLQGLADQGWELQTLAQV